MTRRNPYNEGRIFIGSEFGVDTDTYEDAKVRRIVEGMWTGGWEGFLRDNGFKSVERPVTPDTEIGQIALIRAAIGQTFRIGMLDRIVRFSVTDDEIILRIICHEITTWHSRIRVLQQGTRVYIWDFDDGRWWMREDYPATFWDERIKSYDVLGQYSKLRDLRRNAEDNWQWEWCYRPGTPKSPMDGPWRRDQ